jgi:hypothetical protein
MAVVVPDKAPRRSDITGEITTYLDISGFKIGHSLNREDISEVIAVSRCESLPRGRVEKNGCEELSRGRARPRKKTGTLGVGFT